MTAACVLWAAPVCADGFDQELQAGIDELNAFGQRHAVQNPNSLTMQNLNALFDRIGQGLIQRNEELRTQNTPVEERIPILRDLYLGHLRAIYAVSRFSQYNPLESTLHIDDSKKSGGPLSPKLQKLFDIPDGIVLDPFSQELQEALKEVDQLAWEYRGETIREISDQVMVNAATRFPRPWRMRSMTIYHDNGVSEILKRIRNELTLFDMGLSNRNAPREERVAKLREEFLVAAEELRRYKPLVQYDESDMKVDFIDLDRRSIELDGKLAAFEFPARLTELLEMREYRRAERMRSLKRAGKTAGVLAAAALIVLAAVYFMRPGAKANEANS